jgi:predicted MPP superfamily phosphohydrolase
VFQVLVNRWRSKALSVSYTASAIWLGTLHILLLACGIFWIIAAIIFPTGRMLPWGMLGMALFAAAILVSAYAVYNSFHTRMTRYDIRLPNLPPAWRGRRAILVADTHLGNVRGAGSTRKLVRLVNQEKPDIVFIPGDFFDGPLADYAALAAPLADIKAPFGTYFTEGNHEEFKDPEPYLAALRAAGVKILNNETIEIDGLQILGVPNNPSYKSKDLRAILEKMTFDAARPTILMKHAPTARRVAAEAGISLMLSGHTHKGQMWPFNFFARRVFGKAAYGHSEKGGMQIITTSGFGTWGPPHRLGTKAEIVVITFL